MPFRSGRPEVRVEECEWRESTVKDAMISALEASRTQKQDQAGDSE